MGTRPVPSCFVPRRRNEFREIRHSEPRSAHFLRCDFEPALSDGWLRIDLPDVSDRPPKPRAKQDSRPAVMTASEMRAHERANIEAALQACAGKVFGPGGAAELLDIKPTTLASRIKALGISNARGLAGYFGLQLLPK